MRLRLFPGASHTDGLLHEKGGGGGSPKKVRKDVEKSLPKPRKQLKPAPMPTAPAGPSPQQIQHDFNRRMVAIMQMISSQEPPAPPPPPPPATTNRDEVDQAGHHTRTQQKRRRGYLASVFAGETGGYRGNSTLG